MLKNERFAGKSVVTSYGKIHFDEEGLTNDLTAEQEESFAHIDGYEVIKDTPKSEDKQDEEAEPTEEVPEQPEEDTQADKEPVEEEAPEYTKAKLMDKTVAQLEELAKEENIELKGSKKKEKVQDILDALEERK